jgi:hypothetical protein
VRLLENEAKSLAEADYAWAEFLNSNASAFTLANARRRDQKRVCRIRLPSEVREYFLTCQKQQKAMALQKAREMKKKVVESGASYKYTPDFDDSSSDSDDDDYDDGDAYGHLYAVDSQSSGTNTPSSSVERSPVIKSGAGFYNMPEYTTSTLSLSIDDGFGDFYTDSINDREPDTPTHPENLRGVVGSSGNFTHSSDIASDSTFAQMPLIYPNLPMPPPPGLKIPRFAGDHDESGDVALQTPQFAIDLNESLDRALHDYENTTFLPIDGDSSVSLESGLRNRNYTVVEKKSGDKGKVSKSVFAMCPTSHEAVMQRALQESTSGDSSLARDDSSRRHRRRRRRKEHKYGKTEADGSPANVGGAQERRDEDMISERLTTHQSVLNTNPGSHCLLGRLIHPLHVAQPTIPTFYSHANIQFVSRPRRKHRHRARTYDICWDDDQSSYTHFGCSLHHS